MKAKMAEGHHRNNGYNENYLKLARQLDDCENDGVDCGSCIVSAQCHKLFDELFGANPYGIIDNKKYNILHGKFEDLNRQKWEYHDALVTEVIK